MDKDKKPVERWVEVGLNNNVNAEIKSGLNEGEQVIVSQKTSASSDSNTSSTRVRMPRGM
jgi:macrolide-specific efflux system membrane fusion protein